MQIVLIVRPKSTNLLITLVLNWLRSTNGANACGDPCSDLVWPTGHAGVPRVTEVIRD